MLLPQHASRRKTHDHARPQLQPLRGPAALRSCLRRRTGCGPVSAVATRRRPSSCSRSMRPAPAADAARPITAYYAAAYAYPYYSGYAYADAEVDVYTPRVYWRVAMGVAMRRYWGARRGSAVTDSSPTTARSSPSLNDGSLVIPASRHSFWSIFRKSGNRFSAENATNERSASITPARSRPACRKNPWGEGTRPACRGRRSSARRRRARARPAP